MKKVIVIVVIVATSIAIWFAVKGEKGDTPTSGPDTVVKDTQPKDGTAEKLEPRQQGLHYAKPESIPPRWEEFYAKSQMKRLNDVTKYMDDTTLSPDVYAFFKAELYNREHWDVTRNNMANAMVWARDVNGKHPDPDLHEDFIKMLEDENEDPVWRDYCLQFLSEFLPNSSDPERVKAVIVKYSKGTDGIAGTASVHLALQEQYGGVTLDEAFNQQLAEQLENPEVVEETKLSIIAVMGKRKDVKRLPVIRTYAKQDKDAGMKRVAIAAIGVMAESAGSRAAVTDEDRALVEAALTHKNRAVVMAAKAALARIGNR